MHTQINYQLLFYAFNDEQPIGTNKLTYFTTSGKSAKTVAKKFFATIFNEPKSLVNVMLYMCVNHYTIFLPHQTELSITHSLAHWLKYSPTH